MHSIGSDDVGSALLITFLLLVVSISVVALTMWWLYRVFKTSKNTQKEVNDSEAESS